MKLDLSVLERSTKREEHLKSLGCDSVVNLTKEPSFPLPNVANLDAFQKDVVEYMKPSHGTTTLGFVINDGIIIAVDSRATQGSYISSQSVKKYISINPYLLGTMAGGAADCSFWERYLGMKCRLYELENKKRITVRAASKIMAQIMFQYKGMGLSVGTMIAGWDTAGPGLYYVDSEGQRTNGKMFAVGSGSLYAYGVMDNGFRSDMNVEEAAELGRQAIFQATYRDAASGGNVSVIHITKDGWKKISGDDVGDLYYKYNSSPEVTLLD
ncbi:hypothetical protein BSKO_10384 [Bryopsis sp. KO-2023]|nr:hypothetical protein BSKO_10384 [Bryopsis sp. KO-2023]